MNRQPLHARNETSDGSHNDVTTHLDPKTVDLMLAQELHQLSFTDRLKAQEELHCIGTVAVEETPEMINSALKKLELEIQSIPLKPAYDEGLRVNGQYIHDREFRLRFLRAELFDAQKAAVRFIRHLEVLLELFGTVALMRPLRISDFGKKEMDLIKAGYVQFLPSRDRAGRLVMIGMFDGTYFQAPEASRVRKPKEHKTSIALHYFDVFLMVFCFHFFGRYASLLTSRL
jgi:hypothetical protein